MRRQKHLQPALSQALPRRCDLASPNLIPSSILHHRECPPAGHLVQPLVLEVADLLVVVEAVRRRPVRALAEAVEGQRPEASAEAEAVRPYLASAGEEVVHSCLASAGEEAVRPYLA